MDEIRERYELTMERIRAMKQEQTVSAPFYAYFRSMADFILEMDAYRRDVEAGKQETMSLEELQEQNRRLYRDLIGEAYAESYASPTKAVELLGEGYGQILSFLYTELRGMIIWAAEGRMMDLTITAELFVEFYNAFEEDTPSPEKLKELLYWHMSDYCDVLIPDRIREQLDPSLDFAADIICHADLGDPRYLYRFGEYISENELGVSRFLAGLPEAEIEAMASTFTEGYRMGFVAAGIDLGKKKTVNIRYSLGFERVVRAAIAQFRKLGLESILYREARHSINRRPQGNPGYGSTKASRQYEFDHKEDMALYLDKKLNERRLSVLHSAYEEYKELAAVHAGPAVMEIFGEHPFMPENCPEAIRFDEKQQALMVSYNSEAGQLVNRYIPGDERSFTIIAWPIPEIGENYEEIFRETVKINNLDYHLYQGIQQKLIDALDEGESVYIKGAGENRTEMYVQLWQPADREKETIFENCVADVNIPVGEVFTSPKLQGTHGTLHVSQVYLNEFRYADLELTFEDGKITAYTCRNFADEAENKQFIRANVLFNHETLPLGEFAIGTNTTAYMVAKKYDIGAKLPILIAEKMGPHFAVGDTCYSWCEDNPVYNPDGKEIIARDNECSLLRKTDVSQAYFNCHTDITIPYDELDRIEVVRPDGRRIALIADGRFVLPGTEELNRPFEEA
ncbi:aminopeptidase [Candidatus Merdisoma sp. HCP28S3_D10]|uniref:aminopeptidase n=1 Tax=unclassified Candidatus Merdisoma TaxID=3099611 RepID=UPI003F8C9DA2